MKILPPRLALGLRPHLGLHGYKPFVLLYTTGGRCVGLLEWRNAEDMLPIPLSRDDFFSGESRLAGPVHVPLVPPTGLAPALFRF
jgi:hypothetical protein